MRKISFSFFLMLVQLLAFSQAYDSPESALVIPYQNGWQSGTEAYTTVGATFFEPSSSCYNGVNRWFKVTPGSSYIKIKLTGGTKADNTITTFLSLAIYQGEEKIEIGCVNAGFGNTAVFESINMVPNEVYYLSVSSGNVASKGPFGFEIHTLPDNNFPEGAIELPHLPNWSSGNESYSMIDATPIAPFGGCLAVKNRWFKFEATTSEITLKLIGGTNVENNPTSYLRMTIFKSNLNDVVACLTATTNTVLTFESTELEIGEQYFISVLSGNTSSYGTFGFEVSRGLFQSYWQLSEDVIHPIKLENKIGIGTTAVPADYQLAIKGKAIMEEVKVQLSENWLWPDYVFEEGYDLRTLKEIKAYISENKHLPDVPAAQEVQATGGIEIGAMNALLLRKIEELTLYQIELLERMEQQNKRIAELERLNGIVR